VRSDFRDLELRRDDLEASPLHELVVAKDGKVTVPDGPGLGRDPDMDVLRRYLVTEPAIHRA